MNFKEKVTTILITLLIALLVFYIGIKPEGKTKPQNAYLVYLNGEKIGMIREKQELFDKINKEQEAIKIKYGVDQVYPPTGLEVVKYITYNEKFLNVEDVYNQISEFSIKGYIVNIRKGDKEAEDKQIYILNKEDFDASMQKLITVFIPKEVYENYVKETQKKLIDTGEYIKDINIREKITIKEAYINTQQNILTSEEEISSFLLYGTSAQTKKYLVKKGDTVESIANQHNLNVTELLIANPELKDENALLSSRGDQTLNVSLVNPTISVISTSDLIENQVAYHETVVKYDNKLNVGTSYVQQQGENGVAKVKYEVEYVNGEILDIKKISMVEMSPPINKIIVRGGYRHINVNAGLNPEDWGRPTINYCKISSGFGWRSFDFHDAIDISGCGQSSKGSPVFAVNDGVVIAAYYHPGNPGKHIRINHRNGYFTSYLHLDDYFVKEGQTVKKGDRIGTIGNTGRAYGNHLHFSIYYIPGSDRFLYEPLKYALDPIKVSSAFRY